MTSRPRMFRSTASTPTRRRAASPVAARPRHQRRIHRARDGYSGARNSEHGPGGIAPEELHQGGAVSCILGTWAGGDQSRRLIIMRACARRWKSVDYAGLRKEQAAQRGVQARRDREMHGARPLHQDRRAVRRRIVTFSALRCSTPARSACTDGAGIAAEAQEPGPGPRDHLGANHRHRDRHSRRRHHGGGGNTDNAPYGLGTYGTRSTPVAGAAIAMAEKDQAKAQMIACQQARSARRRPRMGHRRLPRQGLPEKDDVDERHLLGGL